MSPTPDERRRPRALVASLVPVTDSRPSKHVTWLQEAGYEVDVLSTGDPHPAARGRHFRIRVPSLPFRLGAYALMPNRARFAYLVGSRIPAAITPPAAGRYDVVVVHELDLLPWFVAHGAQLTDGPTILDLGEYFGSHGIGLGYRLLFERYYAWLLRLVADPVFDIRTTVADGIAELYAARFGVARPSVILNVAAFADLVPGVVRDDRITLVHHGRADLGRGLALMLDAMLLLDDRFTLVLMLVGSERELRPLRRHPAVATGRVEFRPPVPMAAVPAAINDCDAEIIFFPPRTENLRLVLPNKLFEAIQARLALVVGPSVELVKIVERVHNGVVADGWTAEALASAISGLDAATVQRAKAASHAVAREYSEIRERTVFVDLIRPPVALPRPR